MLKYILIAVFAAAPVLSPAKSLAPPAYVSANNLINILDQEGDIGRNVVDVFHQNADYITTVHYRGTEQNVTDSTRTDRYMVVGQKTSVIVKIQWTIEQTDSPWRQDSLIEREVTITPLQPGEPIVF